MLTKKEARKFKRWNKKNPLKLEGKLSHESRTERFKGTKGNRE